MNSITTINNSIASQLDNSYISNLARQLNFRFSKYLQNSSDDSILLLRDNFNQENNGSGTVNYFNLANWNVTRGSVDLAGQGGFDNFFPENVLYLDLDGTTLSAGQLESKTNFNFKIGDQVTLRFSLAGSQRGDTNSVTVSLGSLFNETFTLQSSQPFTQITRSFIVTSPANVNLVFDHTGGDNFGLLLDDIQLSKTAHGILPEAYEDGFPYFDIQTQQSNDYLNDSQGNDIITGVDPNSLNAGFSEIDILLGKSEKDQFILGEANQFYYNDANDAELGLGDYAMITDFQKGINLIQLYSTLYSTKSNYTFGSSSFSSLSDISTFYQNLDRKDLIDIVSGVSALNIDSNAFNF